MLLELLQGFLLFFYFLLFFKYNQETLPVELTKINDLLHVKYICYFFNHNLW